MCLTNNRTDARPMFSQTLQPPSPAAIMLRVCTDSLELATGRAVGAAWAVATTRAAVPAAPAAAVGAAHAASAAAALIHRRRTATFALRASDSVTTRAAHTDTPQHPGEQLQRRCPDDDAAPAQLPFAFRKHVTALTRNGEPGYDFTDSTCTLLTLKGRRG